MVSSHLLSEIDQIATHVGIISSGELVFQDSLSSLHERSRHSIAVRTLDNEAAVKILGGRGISCRIQEDYILLPKLSDNELAGHIHQIFERNIAVVRIEERHKSLEDIFLELTGTAVSL